MVYSAQVMEISTSESLKSQSPSSELDLIGTVLWCVLAEES